MGRLWDCGTDEDLETLFPPKVYSVTETCPEGVNDDDETFNALNCEWTEETSSIVRVYCLSPVALPYVLTMPDAFNVTKDYIESADK